MSTMKEKAVVQGLLVHIGELRTLQHQLGREIDRIEREILAVNRVQEMLTQREADKVQLSGS